LQNVCINQLFGFHTQKFRDLTSEKSPALRSGTRGGHPGNNRTLSVVAPSVS